MKVTLIISILFLFASCKKHNSTITNLNSNKIDVLGHAGSGIASLYPINSMESFLNCFSEGANGTELDVQLTADDVLVAFHDENLNNSTNLTGKVRSKTWEELSNGFYDVVPMTQYKIIRVKDLLEATYSSDRIFTFDIKLLQDSQESQQLYMDVFAQKISDLFIEYNLYDQAFVESQSEAFILTLAGTDSSIKQFIYPQIFEDGLSIATGNDLFGITISTKNISAEQVDFAHSLGLRVTIWDVHSKKENREAVIKNPDMIQTDKVNYLVQYLN